MSFLNLPLTEQLLLEGIDNGLHLGAQLYVSLDGQVIADEGIGESRPGVRMDRDTINIWMSCTKPITAVLFAQLYERGLIDLDHRVSEIVPEFGQGDKEAVTFRHILTHTGGFRKELSAPESMDWENNVQAVCQMPLEDGWVPGEKAGYHPSSSWYILAEAVSRIAKRPFPVLVRERVFAPLSMDDSWIGIPTERIREYGDRIGWMFLTRRGVEKSDAINNEAGIAHIRPSGNGRGPVCELGAFYEVLLDLGGEVIGQATVTEFTRRHRIDTLDHTFRHTMDWGLGFMVDNNRHGPDTVPYSFGIHASERVFGHGGSQSSVAFADPEHQLVVAWVCNGMPGEPRHNKRARELNTAIYEDLGLTST